MSGYKKGIPIRRVRDIPSEEELRELLRTDPIEFNRVYCESIRLLTRHTTWISVTAIVIAILSFLLSAKGE